MAATEITSASDRRVIDLTGDERHVVTVRTAEGDIVFQGRVNHMGLSRRSGKPTAVALLAEDFFASVNRG